MTEAVTLHAGDKVKFADDRRYWTVRAADTRYAILTRQAAFKPVGVPVYTIIDWERGVRGPSDRLGNGWDVTTRYGIESLLTALNAAGIDRAEVSYRKSRPVAVGKVRSADRAAA